MIARLKIDCRYVVLIAHPELSISILASESAIF